MTKHFKHNESINVTCRYAVTKGNAYTGQFERVRIFDTKEKAEDYCSKFKKVSANTYADSYGNAFIIEIIF